MPYIAQVRREELDVEIDALIQALRKIDAEPGDLNYAITRLVLGMGARGYAAMSAVRAVLFDAADEYYRREMAIYEDRKISENGDVF